MGKKINDIKVKSHEAKTRNKKKNSRDQQIIFNRNTEYHQKILQYYCKPENYIIPSK